MHKLQYKKGLLYTSISLMHEGQCITIPDVIIDTGAFHTILLTDYLAQLDVGFSDEDELVKASGYGGAVYSAVRKKVDKIQMGDIFINDIKLDFGVIDPQERVNGLIGLDFLRAAGVIIDLVESTVYKK